MAKRTSTLAFSNATDALYSAWVNEIYNSLIAFGWVQTSDSGSTTFGGTLTAPSGTSTYPHWGIFRMADSLQATCAVYMRIDFGEAGSTDGPAIKVQVAIGGTNGSGTLTGNVATQYISSNNTASATINQCRCAGSTSSFRCNMWASRVSNSGFIFAVERDLDISGNEASTGVNFLACSPTGNFTTSTSQFLELAGGTGPVETRWYAMLQANTPASNTNNPYGYVGVAPVRCSLGPFRNPMKTVLLFNVSDYKIETTNPVVIYGVSHTYLMLYAQAGAVTTNNSINTICTGCGVAFLWE